MIFFPLVAKVNARPRSLHNLLPAPNRPQPVPHLTLPQRQQSEPVCVSEQIIWLADFTSPESVSDQDHPALRVLMVALIIVLAGDLGVAPASLLELGINQSCAGISFVHSSPRSIGLVAWLGGILCEGAGQ